MLRPKEVAEILGISAATLRLWSNRFAPLLSPAAQKTMTAEGTAGQRRYTQRDLAYFQRAKILLSQGLTYEQVLERLKEGEQEKKERKILDTYYHFHGTWDKEPKGVCRVRLIEREGQSPILILSELEENGSTSVTNMVEILAAEILARFAPQRFEVVGEEPALVIEHYEPQKDERRGVRGKPTYDLVNFSSFVPRKVWLGGRERLSVGEPSWKPLSEEEVRSLLGKEVDEDGA